MKVSNSRVVGENALDKAVRLLARVNERFSDPDTPGMEEFSIRLGPNGCGEITNGPTVLTEFFSTDELLAFLEGSLQKQVREIANQ